MNDLLREAPLGQFLRYVSGNRCFLYPEEKPNFQLPLMPSHSLRPNSAARSLHYKGDQTLNSSPAEDGSNVIMVGWYDHTDDANPQNWENWKRSLVCALIFWYTFVVCCGSSIYVMSGAGVIAEFGVSDQQSLLPLSLYILGYGIGPMLLSPLSEIPSIGRNPIYACTLIAFITVLIPTPLISNFNVFILLRFLQGFFGSPSMATGAASLQDVYSEEHMPFPMAAWIASGYVGPSLGPVLSGYAVTSMGWRWSMWILLWISATACILIIILLPETSTPTILLRRAERLRKLKGSELFKSESEVKQSSFSPQDILVNALIKPCEICIKDPALAFAVLYLTYVYGIYYSFFGAFPLVYPSVYDFNIRELGLSFLSILAACVVGCIVYTIYVFFSLQPGLLNGPRDHEYYLIPAVAAAFLPPVGLFIFGFTARAEVHWGVSLSGVVIYSTGLFIIFQCVSIYIPRTYPRYAASMFAASDFVRAAVAAGLIHAVGPLYQTLGIAKGICLIGALSVLGIPGMFYMWLYGKKLRAKSKFANS
ncbi:major facilitator superfamily domain-containing protein [Bisporella sp. PMI_857]|nr:major facilitator superfamily domain-containing protein [Bisporella sp. PMI_857]